MLTISQPKDLNCKICTFHLDEEEKNTNNTYIHWWPLFHFHFPYSKWRTTDGRHPIYSNLFQFAWDAWSFLDIRASQIETNRLSWRLGKVIYGRGGGHNLTHRIRYVIKIQILSIWTHVEHREPWVSGLYFHIWLNPAWVDFPQMMKLLPWF